MLQLQYLNTKLQKKHIDQILSNFNIKYTTMKNEIENKINIMIKTFNQDISTFLNTMGEIAEERQKLRQIERNQDELESVREELKDKIHEQTKLRREIELLKIENNRLKSGYNSNNNSKRIFSPTKRENTYQGSNNTSLNQTQKKIKDSKSYIYKTEKKDKKDNKKTRFKSPATLNLRNRKKINTLNVDEKNKITKKKSNFNKLLTHKKNALSGFNIEVKTEPNINNKLIKSQRNILKKNTKDDLVFIKRRIFNKKGNLGKSLFNNNKSGILKKNNDTKFFSKTTRNFNKINKTMISKTLNEPEKQKIRSASKRDEDKSMNKDSSSLSDDESQSKTSSENEDESENNINIDEEISEMNDLEDEILSLMDEIKDFKENNKNLI